MVGPGKLNFVKIEIQHFENIYGPTKGHFCQILKNFRENNKPQEPNSFGTEKITPKNGELDAIKAKN